MQDRPRTEIFFYNEKGTHYKTCDGCRNKYKGKKLLDITEVETESTTTAEEEKYNRNGCRDKRFN